MTEPKRTLVTGGAGFIGSHLVDHLLKRECQVTVLDNLQTGRLENLRHLKDNARLTFHQKDIAAEADLARYFEDVDWVFHLGALADIVPSIQQPLLYHQANVDGTVAVLEAARLAGVKRLIYAASSSCYGLPTEFPTPESAAISPMYPYALTKYLGEQYVMHWHQTYKLPCISLRLFNVYGPRSRTSGAYGAVFGVFLAQKLARIPFTVVGDGTQTRDFTFVTDVAEAFCQAAESSISGEIFNVGSGGTYSVNQLIDQLGGDAIFIPKRPGEPDCTFADTAKISRELKWSPKVSFEEGVRIMLENIEYWRQAPVWTERAIADATSDWFKYLGDSEAGNVA